ncbi:unnamed protein product [Withania somnifera]
MHMLKQMRVRFSGTGEEEKGGNGSTRDRTIPRQKTQSFKVEEKSEYDHRRTNSGGDKILSKIKSKAEDIAKKPEKLSGQKAPSIKKTPTFGYSKPESEDSEKAKTAPSTKKTPTLGNRKPESEVGEKAKRAPSMKRTSTFPEKTDTRAPKTPEVPVSDPAGRPTRQSSSQPGMAKAPNTVKPGTGNTKADIWEKEEMEKIRERYKKLIKEIVEWETKKKAKRELEKVEAEILSNEKMKLQAELDRRRAKAVRHFNNEVGRIKSIAGGAKEQANQY